MKYGFYSAQAVEAGCGTCFYQTPTGGTVEITIVCDTMTEGSPAGGYLWEDTRYVGMVTDFLKSGQESFFDCLEQDSHYDYEEQDPCSEVDPIVYH